MKIDGNQKVDEDDFSIIEKHYGFGIPKEIKHFLQKYNGEIVEPEDGLELRYTSLAGKQTRMNYFPTILHTKAVIPLLETINAINDFIDEDGLGPDDVEVESLLPIIEVCGGSLKIYIALSGRHKLTLFLVDNGDFGVCKVDYTLAEIVHELDTKA